MKVLICGAGIAGCTLAWWLARDGFEVTLVEKAPAPRTGGYVIDFWGTGFEVGERMGLLAEICRRGYRVEEVRVVNAAGRRIAGFPASAFSAATGGRYTSLPRGELAAVLFGAIAGRVEVIFGTHPITPQPLIAFSSSSRPLSRESSRGSRAWECCLRRVRRSPSSCAIG